MKNIKNLTQTYCPLCFKKLVLRFLDGSIPQGMIHTIKGNFYKREIIKTEKGNVIFFCGYNKKKVVNKIYQLSASKNHIKSLRLKLNNKMCNFIYSEKHSKFIKYSMWECSDDNCFYFKCIDEVNYFDMNQKS